jgi:hypothetical protein
VTVRVLEIGGEHAELSAAGAISIGQMVGIMVQLDTTSCGTATSRLCTGPTGPQGGFRLWRFEDNHPP